MMYNINDTAKTMDDVLIIENFCDLQGFLTVKICGSVS